jgi:hypothetical protein
MGVFLGPGGVATVDLTYTPPADPPSSITLQVTLAPHSLGFTCGPGSQGGVASRTYPL